MHKMRSQSVNTYPIDGVFFEETCVLFEYVTIRRASDKDAAASVARLCSDGSERSNNHPVIAYDLQETKYVRRPFRQPRRRKPALVPAHVEADDSHCGSLGPWHPRCPDTEAE